MRELRLDDETFLELAAEILLKGGSFQFRAHGSSMAPFIRAGDLLTVAPAEPATLQTGDVALFCARRDRVVAHRVVSKSLQGGEWVLETRGDARPASDRPVRGDRVLGRVVRIQRGRSTYRLDRGPWLLAARLWMRLLPLRRILARPLGQVRGTALRMLNGLQSLKPYCSLAQRIFGARARIRPAGARDAVSISRLFGQETLPGTSQPVGALARGVVLENGLALIATIANRPAGAIAVRHFPDDDPLYPGWWLLGPVVRARYRRAGIGRELLRQALKGAASRGATWVYLLAYEDDTATRSLARQAGFLPATLPALQACLDDPPWPDEPRRIILGCALPARVGPV